MNIELEQLEIVKMLLRVRDRVTLEKIRHVLLNAQEEGRISIKQ